MSELGGLSMVIGAVLCRIVRQYGAESAGLKWPNDIVVDARKLAGVLVDIHGSADGPVDAIIGAPKLMHTVIAQECTGCDLCLPPCPVDCIEMVEPSPSVDRYRRPAPLRPLLEDSR